VEPTARATACSTPGSSVQVPYKELMDRVQAAAARDVAGAAAAAARHAIGARHALNGTAPNPYTQPLTQARPQHQAAVYPGSTASWAEGPGRPCFAPHPLQQHHQLYPPLASQSIAAPAGAVPGSAHGCAGLHTAIPVQGRVSGQGRAAAAGTAGATGALQRLPDPAGEVAKNFRVPGYRGTVSFITSMTSKFCSDCNRWVSGGAVGLSAKA
jgi:hypothetical protein